MKDEYVLQEADMSNERQLLWVPIRADVEPWCRHIQQAYMASWGQKTFIATEANKKK